MDTGKNISDLNHVACKEIPAETLAAIVAAASVFLGTRFRIRSLELLHSDRGPVNRWTRQGRTSIQASHNPRLKR